MNIPIKDLIRDNIETEWNDLLCSIQDSMFISLDIEMSGLGDRGNLNSKFIDERYMNIKKIASSHSVMSLGVSCFKLIDQNAVKNTTCVNIQNKTFNLYTLCNDDYLTEAGSSEFLKANGFDFDLHKNKGIRYYKGNDKNENADERQFIRELFIKIYESQVPIVLHNGFIDLIFLYENFYAECPNNLSKFVADISKLFSGGIFDTKYVAEFHQHSKATYLEYLYKLALHENTHLKIKKLKHYIDISFDQDAKCSFDLDLHNVQGDYDKNSMCKMFSSFGFCKDGLNCKKTHNVDIVLKMELMKSKKRANTLHSDNLHQETPNENDCLIKDSESSSLKNNIHSAGFDAFMTGYIMLHYLNKYSEFKMKDLDDINTENGMPQTDLKSLVKLTSFAQMDLFLFNVYLPGKDYPFMIRKSMYSSNSDNFMQKSLRQNKNDN